MHFPSKIVRRSLAAGFLLFLISSSTVWSATGRSHLGPSVDIGKGRIRTVVVADASGAPTAIGVEFTAGMLSGLPAKPNAKNHSLDWHYYLKFPKGGPATGYDHVLVDWHPMGHPPKGIYTVPHFDFHFYVIDQKSQMGIHYTHPETPDMGGVTMPAPALIPAGYFIPPGTQVNEMGVHAVPKAAPEFNGKPFTNTLIYGYSEGKLAFVEGMATIKYLRTRPRATETVPAPNEYSYPGYYPRSYSVAYDAKNRLYRLMFGDLKAWKADALERRTD